MGSAPSGGDEEDADRAGQRQALAAMVCTAFMRRAPAEADPLLRERVRPAREGPQFGRGDAQLGDAAQQLDQQARHDALRLYICCWSRRCALPTKNSNHAGNNGIGDGEQRQRDIVDQHDGEACQREQAADDGVDRRAGQEAAYRVDAENAVGQVADRVSPEERRAQAHDAVPHRRLQALVEMRSEPDQ